MKIISQKLAAIALSAVLANAAIANIDVYQFDSTEQETRYRALIEELRCPKCQNQNLAGSDAPIAQDLKQKTYEMIKDGRSDGEIRQYMFDRYGDYISYKPPVRPSTWILWFFPPVLLLVLIIGWLYRNRKQRAIQHNQEDIQALSRAEEDKLAKILATHSDDNKDKS